MMIGSTIVKGILGAMGKAALGIVVKLATADFFQKNAERATVHILRKWAAQTENTLDDAMVEDIAQRLGVE